MPRHADRRARRDEYEAFDRALIWSACNGDPAASMAIVASDELVLDDAHRGTFCAATVLRGFDRLRRQVSLRLTAHEGLFVGYDRFELMDQDPPAGTVCLVAQVTDRGPSTRHRVRYSAYAHLEAGGRFGRIDLLIAHGVGTTVVPPDHRPWRGESLTRADDVPAHFAYPSLAVADVRALTGA